MGVEPTTAASSALGFIFFMNAAFGLRAAVFPVDLAAAFAGAAFFAVFFAGIGALLMDDDDPLAFDRGSVLAPQVRCALAERNTGAPTSVTHPTHATSSPSGRRTGRERGRPPQFRGWNAVFPG